MSTNELIDSLKTGDNVAANKAFNGIMGEKLKAALDARKIDVASSMGATPKESEIEVEIEAEQENGE